MKWEYNIVEGAGITLEDLNKLGDQRWELCGRKDLATYPYVEHVFKRPKPSGTVTIRDGKLVNNFTPLDTH